MSSTQVLGGSNAGTSGIWQWLRDGNQPNDRVLPIPEILGMRFSPKLGKSHLVAVAKGIQTMETLNVENAISRSLDFVGMGWNSSSSAARKLNLFPLCPF